MYNKNITGDVSKKYIDKIVLIYKENFPEKLKQKLHKFKKTINKYDYVNLLIKNEEIVGFAFFNWFSKIKLLHLDYISLDKSVQGNGNGSKYLNEIIKLYYDMTHFYGLVLECENRLVKFYEKNLFVRIPCDYSYNGTKLNLMLINKKLKKSKIKIISEMLETSFYHPNYFPDFLFIALYIWNCLPDNERLLLNFYLNIFYTETMKLNII